jgi:RNA polymerase sigma-70 factor, ECF subfamily
LSEDLRDGYDGGVAALVETVRQARPELALPDTFGTMLEARVASARAAWRDVPLDPERFAYHLATRLEAPVGLDRLHVEDLYLACGCLDELPGALAAFDRTCVAGIELAISAAGIDAHAVPTVRRKICDRLLVKFGELPPKLASYAGKGSLGSWVRIFAMREAQRLAAQGSP